jgi:general secretion pathway protein M
MNRAGALEAFWSERAPRERRILVAAAVLIALAIVYLICIEPAARGVAKLQRALPQARHQAAQLDALLAEARTLRKAPVSATPAAGDARGAVLKSLEAAGLQPAHADPLPNGDMRLSFANVAYGKWTAWLATAEQTLGVQTTAVHLKASGTPGNADIELSLRLPRA